MRRRRRRRPGRGERHCRGRLLLLAALVSGAALLGGMVVVLLLVVLLLLLELKLHDAELLGAPLAELGLVHRPHGALNVFHPHETLVQRQVVPYGVLGQYG